MRSKTLICPVFVPWLVAYILAYIACVKLVNYIYEFI
jgi:hypothetical protein